MVKRPTSLTDDEFEKILEEFQESKFAGAFMDLARDRREQLREVLESIAPEDLAYTQGAITELIFWLGLFTKQEREKADGKRR